MAVPSYGAGLIAFCESKGLAEVRRLRHVENHFHSLDWDRVDRWVSVKESERIEESNFLAHRANSIAYIAVIIAAIAAHKEIMWLISSVMSWFSK